MPEDTAIIWVVATYGEGEPTDNAVPLMDFLKAEDTTFSEGDRVEGLKYVIFALGNRTYEQFCAVGHHLDEALSKRGGKRIGKLGEGDDDKSMEEDYLEWKDGMFEALSKEMGWEEGAGADSADFEVTESSDLTVSDPKVFTGELSQRMLAGTRGVYDAKNPFISPLKTSRELFTGGDRNCVHAEFDIADSGIRYQSGDHVGVWPINPDDQVLRWLKLLGLENKKDTVIQIKSLDPALAKVPFPTPCTYDAIGTFAQFAPNDQAKAALQRLGSDKAAYQKDVGEKCLKLAEVLTMAAGDDPHQDPHTFAPTVWQIPFDRVVSGIPRLQPRYYCRLQSQAVN